MKLVVENSWIKHLIKVIIHETIHNFIENNPKSSMHIIELKLRNNLCIIRKIYAALLTHGIHHRDIEELKFVKEDDNGRLQSKVHYRSSKSTSIKRSPSFNVGFLINKISIFFTTTAILACFYYRSTDRTTLLILGEACASVHLWCKLVSRISVTLCRTESFSLDVNTPTTVRNLKWKSNDFRQHTKQDITRLKVGVINALNKTYNNKMGIITLNRDLWLVIQMVEAVLGKEQIRTLMNPFVCYLSYVLLIAVALQVETPTSEVINHYNAIIAYYYGNAPQCTATLNAKPLRFEISHWNSSIHCAISCIRFDVRKPSSVGSYSIKESSPTKMFLDEKSMKMAMTILNMPATIRLSDLLIPPISTSDKVFIQDCLYVCYASGFFTIRHAAQLYTIFIHNDYYLPTVLGPNSSKILLR
ncbi:hypothetical protein BDF20DRAFT_839375 [Mycotypha africana]|uniref:uncharacterized protein n=1 Tax=Mycotypha africana TaxID=64632 RepID=UPI002300605B|nr:uncharacterized protein BDF20DRAFT_839375 [Mycotypha africana]KAI8968254.1 hypothetical protein BDF20DRAFT_839375 [Mycotypha africana]